MEKGHVYGISWLSLGPCPLIDSRVAKMTVIHPFISTVTLTSLRLETTTDFKPLGIMCLVFLFDPYPILGMGV